MYRQLWLAMILSTLLALIGSLLASTLNSKAYLQEQLRMKNADNSAALALSLSQKHADAIEIELAVSALFDSGHYESIRVSDPGGRAIVERVSPSVKQSVPAWFVRALPLSAQPGIAQISNGWHQVGTVSLISNNSFAYRMLWHSTLQMVAILIFAGLIGAYLGMLILRRLKSPLDIVTKQARDISERRFVTVPEPKVPELKQLSAAMNSTVMRLKAMLDEEAQRLEALRREVNHDSLTGLANRSYFMGHLRALTTAEDSPNSTLILMRVAYLAEKNRRLGRESTDELLKQIAKTIDDFARRFSDGMAARLNGADFGLLLPGQNEATRHANELLQLIISNTSAFTDNQPIAFIGSSEFGFGIEISALLAQVDAALASAETTGHNAAHQSPPLVSGKGPISSEQWMQMIQQSLERRWLKLVSYPVMSFSSQLVHNECPLRLMSGNEGEWLSAGQFFPVAERLGLSSELDLSAISLGLEELGRNPGLQGLAVNVSARSIEDDKFLSRLRSLLSTNPGNTRRLWLEFTEHGALAHLDLFRRFCHEFSRSGCKIGLEHFGRQFSQIGKLHDLGLDYIKVDASFIREIDINNGNQPFLKGLTSIAHNMGMQVFAEGVSTSEEIQSLSILGFDGVTGPAVTYAS
jgi:diguanylate cyclase (GGDEF)-like protein